MTLEEIETAAFWDRIICLDCHAETDADQWVESCPACGSKEVMPARKVLKCLDVLDKGAGVDY